MFKKYVSSVAVVAAMIMSFSAKADINQTLMSANEALFADVGAYGMDWKVGDEANYSLDMGFIKGTMKMAVKSITSDVLVLSQDMDLGFAGKQSCETQLNPNTGEVLKMTCNGQDQAKPNPADNEVLEMKEDQVTVAAGTFKCIYIKVLNKKENKEIQQWANPKLVPVSGMIKTLAPSPMGEMKVELTRFIKK